MRGASADVQVMTAHFEAFGAKEIHRAEFLRRLKKTAESELKLF